MPHSYGSSFTLLYFSECSRLEKTSVNSAKPVATTTKMAIGMYAESILGGRRPARCARRPEMNRSGLYHTPLWFCNLPQVAETKQFFPRTLLDALPKRDL